MIERSVSCTQSWLMWQPCYTHFLAFNLNFYIGFWISIIYVHYWLMWRAMLRPSKLTIFWLLIKWPELFGSKSNFSYFCACYALRTWVAPFCGFQTKWIYILVPSDIAVFTCTDIWALGLFVLWPKIESFYVFNPGPWENGLPNLLLHNLMQGQQRKLSSMTDHVGDFFDRYDASIYKKCLTFANMKIQYNF